MVVFKEDGWEKLVKFVYFFVLLSLKIIMNLILFLIVLHIILDILGAHHSRRCC